MAIRNQQEKAIINYYPMVHVLYVLDSLKQRFGVTAVAMNYFKNIDRKLVQVDFLCYSDSETGIVDEIRERGGKVFFMPNLSMKNLFAFRRFLHDFFRQHPEYQIVHSHFNQLDAIIFPIAKKHGVTCCISHSHNTKYSDYKIRAFRNWLMCIPLKSLADVWGACSEKAGRFLYGKGFDTSKKKFVINNAVDLKKYAYNPIVRAEVRKELGVANEIVLGNVGSLKLQKNQEFLIRLMAELQKRSKDNQYKLVIVGDGDLKEHLTSLAQDLGVANKVTFTGSRKDVERLLQAFDIFLLPSLYEGLPVIGIEAQTAGLPCLFSNEITREVDICNVKFLSIDDNYNEWGDEIDKLLIFNRQDVSEKVKEKGFDIKHEASRLAEYYIAKVS